MYPHAARACRTCTSDFNYIPYTPPPALPYCCSGPGCFMWQVGDAASVAHFRLDFDTRRILNRVFRDRSIVDRGILNEHIIIYLQTAVISAITTMSCTHAAGWRALVPIKYHQVYGIPGMIAGVGEAKLVTCHTAHSTEHISIQQTQYERTFSRASSHLHTNTQCNCS